MAMKMKSCDHLDQTKSAGFKGPKAYECEECVKLGDDWVHLRTCQTCGVTLCCDSSKNKHATAHALSHAHPVAASAEPGERWLYCHSDKLFSKY